MFKKNTIAYESTAKVVDGNLIISLPDAVNPVVWRMELGSVKASALEVKAAADGNSMLSLKTPKGEVHDIAPFTTREGAVHALMCVSAALQGAEGRITPIVSLAPAANAPQASHQSYPKEQGGGAGYKWLLALGGVIAVIVLFAYLGSIAPRDGSTAASANIESATSVTGDPNVESGVPMSADQMLRGF